MIKIFKSNVKVHACSSKKDDQMKSLWLHELWYFTDVSLTFLFIREK